VTPSGVNCRTRRVLLAVSGLRPGLQGSLRLATAGHRDCRRPPRPEPEQVTVTVLRRPYGGRPRRPRGEHSLRLGFKFPHHDDAQSQCNFQVGFRVIRRTAPAVTCYGTGPGTVTLTVFQLLVLQVLSNFKLSRSCTASASASESRSQFKIFNQTS
jgi:hypothetical protein